ncbi:hypothetical protein RIF29_37805 [Crotalaria pallida]|uniref:non-specific serine/threonine protein kinase n=1 Tax=Crotalaria pallida TaxID=3830 RepID=A0AAN9DYZ9_CROPI
MDQYEILEQIGKGSFGNALLVRHKLEKKKYVLKKIRLARQTDRSRRSAHQEMELISKVQNPFIVEYKDSWVEKGCFVCIIIGYCEGGDMAEAIKKANGVHFPEEKLCKWLVQLLMALDYLHINHILHRDVKCSNIFLTKDRDIRLGDFGLAKMLTSDDLASSVSDIAKTLFSATSVPIPTEFEKVEGLSKVCCEKIQSLGLRRTRFAERESVSTLSGQDKCSSLSNDRALNPSISGTEKGSQCSTQRAHGLSNCTKEKSYELFVHDESNTNRSKATKSSTVERTPRLRAAKDSANPRKQKKASSKIPCTGSKHDSLPSSHTPTEKFSPSTHQVSIPPPKRATTTTTPYRAYSQFLQNVNSPDVSVNAPRIDKIAEFPLSYCEDPIFTIHGHSSTSARCSSSSTKSADSSIAKDKLTIQNKVAQVPKVSECSKLHQQRFDTSSYQQRAEALEGLLEFSARLLKQQRFLELGVLLKPFGNEKVSSRETAIWLTKSFKETVV